MSSVQTTISGAISDTASEDRRLDEDEVESERFFAEIRSKGALALEGGKSDMCESWLEKAINDPFPNPDSCLTRGRKLVLMFRSSTRTGFGDEELIYMNGGESSAMRNCSLGLWSRSGLM